MSHNPIMLGRTIVGFVLCMLCFSQVNFVWGQSRSPALHERDPFQLLVLTEDAGGSKLQIYPVDEELLQDKTRKGAVLRVRLLAFPDRQFDVDWNDVERVVTFEQLLLQGASRLADQGRFDEAFQYLNAIYESQPDLPGLQQAIAEFMTQAATSSAKRNRYAEAWGTIDFVLLGAKSVDSRDALRSLYGATDKLFRELIAKGDFSQARAMLESVAARYGAAQTRRLTSRWSEQLQTLSDKYVERAEQAKDDPRAALLAVEQALQLAPDSQRAKVLAQQLGKIHPRVIVGVTRSAPQAPAYWNEWASRRVDRLTQRRLLELVGVGSDGARYGSELGKLTTEDGGRSLKFALNADETKGNRDAVTLTSYDLSEVVMNSIDPNNAARSPLWSRAVKSINQPTEDRLSIQLKRPLLRSAAMLTLSLPGNTESDDSSPFAPYQPMTTGRFAVNKDYAFRQPSQPIEIVEEWVELDELVPALTSGRIHCADRLTPADAARLRNVRGVTVRRYQFPSIHFLVPNLDDSRRRLTADRNFRRALVYAINRRTILEQDLSRGELADGCEVISGPFAPGRGADDPLAYAFNQDVLPREYDPTLGVTLASLARRALQAQLKKDTDEAEDVKWPPLVLVHPEDGFCRRAATAIASYLNAAQIDCIVRQLPSGQVFPNEDESWDLAYVDTVMSEPLVDVQRLFGESGLLAGPSPYFQAARIRLAQIEEWAEAREVLRQLHRTAHEEVTVIPLWQWADYYAYRDYVSGVAADAVTLYQGVEDWVVQPGAGL